MTNIDTVSGDAGFVEFRPTPKDLLDAQRLHAYRSKLSACIRLVLFLLAVAGITYALTQDLVAIYFTVGGGLIGTIGHYFLYLPWHARNNFKKQPTLQFTYRYALRPEGLDAESPRGHVLIQWKDFIRWRANNKTTLLYIGPRLFYFIPSHLAELGFPIEELRTSLRRELGPPR